MISNFGNDELVSQELDVTHFPGSSGLPDGWVRMTYYVVPFGVLLKQCGLPETLHDGPFQLSRDQLQDLTGPSR